jgi:PadR family transcriptional regulator, regulatory protein AphA
MDKYVTCEVRAGKPYVASRSSGGFIDTPQDFLDLLAWGSENDTNLFLLEDTNLARDFYDLTTGLAGEILQKISNYNSRLALVGSFDMVVSTRFRELMAESNKGSQVHFASSEDEAISWLMRGERSSKPIG